MRYLKQAEAAAEVAANDDRVRDTVENILKDVATRGDDERPTAWHDERRLHGERGHGMPFGQRRAPTEYARNEQREREDEESADNS